MLSLFKALLTLCNKAQSKLKCKFIFKALITQIYNKRYFILGVITLVAACLFAVKSNEIHKLYLRWHVGTRTFKVLGGPKQGGGTGWQTRLESGKDVIITNRHVCMMPKQRAKQVYIVSNDGKYKQWHKIIKISDKADLCAIEGVKNLKGIKIAKSGPYVGEQVYSVGHPALMPQTVMVGEISGASDVKIFEGILGVQQADGEWIPVPKEMGGISRKECNLKLHKITNEVLDFGFFKVKVKTCWAVETKAYHTNMLGQGGNSGSAVVDFKGDAIGVLFAGDRAGWVRLVSWDRLSEFLKELK